MKVKLFTFHGDVDLVARRETEINEFLASGIVIDSILQTSGGASMFHLISIFYEEESSSDSSFGLD